MDWRKVRDAIESDPERLLRLSEAARMLGVSADDLRTSYCAAHGLTLIDISKPRAQRRRFRMVMGEVVAHRRNLIAQARRRVRVRVDMTSFFNPPNDQP